jgi:hypothetical protein
MYTPSPISQRKYLLLWSPKASTHVPFLLPTLCAYYPSLFILFIFLVPNIPQIVRDTVLFDLRVLTVEAEGIELR